MGLPATSALACLGCLLGLAAGNIVIPGLGKCLDIEAKLKEDGETRETKEDMRAAAGPINVQLYECHGKHNQDWIVADGQIQSASLGRCLTVDGEKAAAGKNVVLVECSDGKAALQKWVFTAYGIQNTGTEFCLDVKAAKKGDGSYETLDEIRRRKVVGAHLYNCQYPDTDRANQPGGAVVSAFEFRGSSAENPADSANLSLALAGTGMVGVFAAGILVGLRARGAAA